MSKYIKDFTIKPAKVPFLQSSDVIGKIADGQECCVITDDGKQMCAIHNGGYFTRKVGGSLSLITLNTNYFIKYNEAVGGCDDSKSPAVKQIHWLQSELKSVEKVNNAHKKQVLTYLKLTDKKLGYLLNFGENLMKDGISRVLNDYVE